MKIIFISVLRESESNDKSKRSTIVESGTFCSAGMRVIQCAIYPLYGKAFAVFNDKVLWLSWLKRLPSKQEITSATLVKTSILLLSSMYIYRIDQIFLFEWGTKQGSLAAFLYIIHSTH